MFFCCVLSGRGLCDGLITLTENFNECGVSECDREASIMSRPWPHYGLLCHEEMLTFGRTEENYRIPWS